MKATFDSLSTTAADACLLKALKAGALVEQAAITEAAPVKDTTGGMLPDGALKSDITVTTHQPKNRSAYVTVAPGKYTAHVARWVEYGHRLVRGGRSRMSANGKTRGSGKEIGTVQEHPFIRLAYESSQQGVTDAISSTLVSEIEKAAANKGKVSG